MNPCERDRAGCGKLQRQQGAWLDRNLVAFDLKALVAIDDHIDHMPVPSIAAVGHPGVDPHHVPRILTIPQQRVGGIQQQAGPGGKGDIGHAVSFHDFTRVGNARHTIEDDHD